jgi:phosphotransferase system enzyme I (PtsI)
MVPNALREVRATLLRYSLEEARMLAQVALAATDAGKARSAVKAALPRPPR